MNNNGGKILSYGYDRDRNMNDLGGGGDREHTGRVKSTCVVTPRMLNFGGD